MHSTIQNANDRGSILSRNTSRYTAMISTATTSGSTGQNVSTRMKNGRVTYVIPNSSGFGDGCPAAYKRIPVGTMEDAGPERATATSNPISRNGFPHAGFRGELPHAAEGTMGRYDRQLIEFSQEEQDRIRRADVGIVGCGGLGTYVSTALALAGIGKLTLMDPDAPDETNLNRQFIYCRHVLSGEEARPKAELMREWILEINPDVEVEAHVGSFDGHSSHVFDGCDVMADCLDSVSARMELNDYSIRKGKPLVHGGVEGFIGEVCTVLPRRTPCLRCMLGGVPDSKTAPASIGSVVMAVGALQSTEILKLVAGREDESRGSFASYDFSCGKVTRIDFERDPLCPACGNPLESLGSSVTQDGNEADRSRQDGGRGGEERFARAWKHGK